METSSGGMLDVNVFGFIRSVVRQVAVLSRKRRDMRVSKLRVRITHGEANSPSWSVRRPNRLGRLRLWEPSASNCGRRPGRLEIPRAPDQAAGAGLTAGRCTFGSVAARGAHGFAGPSVNQPGSAHESHGRRRPYPGCLAIRCATLACIKAFPGTGRRRYVNKIQYQPMR